MKKYASKCDWLHCWKEGSQFIQGGLQWGPSWYLYGIMSDGRAIRSNSNVTWKSRRPNPLKDRNAGRILGFYAEHDARTYTVAYIFGASHPPSETTRRNCSYQRRRSCYHDVRQEPRDDQNKPHRRLLVSFSIIPTHLKMEKEREEQIKLTFKEEVFLQ